VPEDAFFMPEESDGSGGSGSWLAPEPEFADDALIDPDAPIVRREPPRTPEDFEEVVRRDVVVTGIGDDPHLDDDDLVPEPDVEVHVREMARAIQRLGDALRLQGEVGLRITPDMNRFEVTLRAYCVGYLTRAREQAEP
jgi:hypothetical protein